MKKKEMLIIVIIVLSSIIILLTSKIPFKASATSKTTEQGTAVTQASESITITVTGEIIYPSYKLEAKKGITYGEIISIIRNILNDYSVIETDYKKAYYESTEIVIETSDLGNSIDTPTQSKISINKSSYDDLVKLYGIGDKRAQKIINYRQNKKITTWNELKTVIGVSNEVIERIKKEAVL